MPQTTTEPLAPTTRCPHCFCGCLHQLPHQQLPYCPICMPSHSPDLHMLRLLPFFWLLSAAGVMGIYVAVVGGSHPWRQFPVSSVQICCLRWLCYCRQLVHTLYSCTRNHCNICNTEMMRWSVWEDMSNSGQINVLFMIIRWMAAYKTLAARKTTNLASCSPRINIMWYVVTSSKCFNSTQNMSVDLREHSNWVW